jgi:hypothetical protein
MTDPTLQREKVPEPGRPAQPLETAFTCGSGGIRLIGSMPVHQAFSRLVGTKVTFLLGLVFGHLMTARGTP